MSNAHPPWFRRPWALEFAGLAAITALAVVLAVTWAFQRSPDTSGEAPRSGPLPISIIKPSPAAPFDRTFSWRPVDGASSYRVAVFTSDGQRSFEVRDVKGTGVALSATVKLAPGQYSWQVVALRGEETFAESPMTPFEIRDP